MENDQVKNPNWQEDNQSATVSDVHRKEQGGEAFLKMTSKWFKKAEVAADSRNDIWAVAQSAKKVIGSRKTSSEQVREMNGTLQVKGEDKLARWA